MDDFNVAIVIPIFSFSTQRVAGLRKCIDKLHLQTIHPNIYLIELILNEQISDVRFLASENVHYIEVVGNNYNRDLWQKECLLNIGASYLQKEDVVLFMDGDLFTDDIYWLEKVVDELESEKMILQPYLNVVDSINPLLNFSSVASSVNGACSPYPSHGSGSIWAFRYEHFKSFGGFNPYYLEGSGDTAFVMEFLDSTHSSYPQYLMNYPWFAELMRQQKNEYSIGHLDVDFIHINHGDHRYYSDRATYINLFNDFKDYYFLDNKGLLSWRDPCSPLRDALKVILNKINSNFINIDVDTVCTLKEKGIVSFHPYNPIVITSNCSIVSPQANWISVKKNKQLFNAQFVYSLDSDHSVELWITGGHLPSVNFSINEGDDLFVEHYFYTKDYQTMVHRFDKTKIDETRIKFEYDQFDKDFYLWVLSISGEGINSVQFSIQ